MKTCKIAVDPKYDFDNLEQVIKNRHETPNPIFPLINEDNYLNYPQGINEEDIEGWVRVEGYPTKEDPYLKVSYTVTDDEVEEQVGEEYYLSVALSVITFDNISKIININYFVLKSLSNLVKDIDCTWRFQNLEIGGK